MKCVKCLNTYIIFLIFLSAEEYVLLVSGVERDYFPFTISRGSFVLPSHYPECNMCCCRCLAGSEDVCSYLSWCPLASSLQKGDNSALVSASVCAECVRKFDSSLPMTPEQHFYPAALSFGKHSLAFS